MLQSSDTNQSSRLNLTDYGTSVNQAIVKFMLKFLLSFYSSMVTDFTLKQYS